MKLTVDELKQIDNPESLLDVLGIDGPPFNPFEIVRRLPVKVEGNYYKDKLKYSGEIRVDDDRNPIIWINPQDPINRRRFTLAHEIGHLVNDVIPNIDKTGVDDFFYETDMTMKRAGEKLPKEYAANNFAARLLMPTGHILELAKQHMFGPFDSDLSSPRMSIYAFIKAMANTFMVSEKAMEIRLKELRII